MPTACRVLICLGWLAVGAAAQTPAFENLRFDEDWTFLAEPEAETDHLWPDLKHRELGSGWSLGVGGQLRLRAQREENRNLRNTTRTNDFWLSRARLHADLRHESGLRAFVEVLDARITGNELPPIGIDRQPLDVQNAFVEYAEGDTTLRAGRMELQYGAQRYVSPLDWGNTRRRFEGALLRQEFDGAALDVFVTKPVPVDPHGTDHDDDSLSFSGAYSTFELGEQHAIEVYALALNERSNTVTDGGRTGGLDVYSLGLRHRIQRDGFDWDGELTGQTGGFAGAQVRAWSAAARAGYRAGDLPGTPRAGLVVSVASGDDDPTDGTHGTFNQLFPLGHAWLGYLDLVGRQNIIELAPELSVNLGDRTVLRLAQHWFWLHEKKDALYNAGGAPTLVDPTGSSGRDVGRELDLTVAHRPEALGPHGLIVLGASSFNPGGFVERVGSSAHAKLLFAMVQFTF